MIEEQALIVACRGELAWVQTERRSTCEGCAAQQGCGTSVLAKVLGRRANQVMVVNTLAAEVGERVVIGIEERALVRASLSAYGVPLLALLFGAMLGEAAAPYWGIAGEAGAMLLGFSGFGIGLVWLRSVAGRDSRYRPVILRRIAGAMGALGGNRITGAPL